MSQLYAEKIVDRQVGRNTELFAQSVADLATPEERYPYLRIIIAIVEQAHPEWSQAPTKPERVAHLVHSMSRGRLREEEIVEVVRVRDGERGVFYEEQTNGSES